MAGLEQIRAMMDELGPATRMVEEVRQYEDNGWAVVCGENTIIELQFDGGPGKLVFSTDLGKPEENQRLAVYEMLLTYNFLWEDTGGVKMALDRPGGHVVQLYDLDAAELDLGTLQTVLDNFTEKARFWAEVITTGSGRDREAGSTPDSLAGAGPYAIRV